MVGAFHVRGCMQKWEYIEIHVRNRDVGVFTLSINREEQPATAEHNANISRLLNRFGEQGWELASYIQ